MPVNLKSLTGAQLEQLREKLDTWINHYRAEPPAPMAVSTPPPPAGVHVSSTAPPAQHSTGAIPVSVPVPAMNTEHVRTHAAPATLPTSPAFGGGRSRIRLPALQHYNGNADSSKPKVVLAWLRQMHLALTQDKCTDPASIAIMHLKGNAASWRDTAFLPAHETQAVISWPEFETEFKTRSWTESHAWSHSEILER